MRDLSLTKKRYRSNLTDLMIFRNRWWQHLIFWGVALAILLSIFKSSGSLETIDVIYTLIFAVPLMAVVYLNLYLCIPRLLRIEKFLIYALAILALITLGALFLYKLFDSWIDLLLPGYYFISYNNVPVLMLYTGSFLVLTTLLKLSRSWFLLLRVEKMTAGQRFQSLQSQINPHFLLNSLQTIYALSLEKSEHTPEVILQLSEVLKYNLYDTGESTIKLKKELGMISDYVDMYRHRVDPELIEISLEVSGEAGDMNIAPMLLIPFIENAFKHGLRGDPGKAFIHISLEIEDSDLKFQVHNSYGTSEPIDLEQKQGIGIENTRQRLELLYPGRYKLKVEDLSDAFRVNLNLQLSD